MKNGSVDSLKVCEWCEASAKARQIREIGDCHMPVAAAIDRVDQWVVFFGLSSSVLTITRSASASLIFLGAPGPRFVGHAVQATFDEPTPPGADRVRGNIQPTGHRQNRVALGALQHNP